MIKRLLSFTVVFVFATGIYLGRSNGNSPGGGYSNAPGESNCTNCHSGTLVTSGAKANSIKLFDNFTGGGYIPDSTYNLILTQKISGVSKYGFQITALEELTNNAAGTFNNSDNRSQTFTSTVGGKTRYYIGQTSTGTSNTGTDSTSWKFTWKAPNKYVGNIKFYVVINATNSNSQTSGDEIIAKVFTIKASSLLPSAKIKTTDTILCSGNKINFAADVTGSPTGYAWSFPSGSPATSTSSTPQVTYGSQGTYRAFLTLRNNKGSGKTDTFTFQVKQAPGIPTITPGTTQNLCKGDTINMSTTAFTGAKYSWEPYKQTTNTIRVADSGNYKVTLTSTNGCSRTSAVVRVNVLERPSISVILSKGNDTLCPGGKAEIKAIASGIKSDSFWFYDNSNLVQKDTHSIFELISTSNLTRNVYAIGKAANGCVSKASNTITIRTVNADPAPAAVLDNQTTTSYKVTWSAVSGATGYLVSQDSGKSWITPSSGSSGLSHEESGLKPNSPKDLWVIATNNSPCGQTETAIVKAGSKACTNFSVLLSGDTNICKGSSANLKVSVRGVNNYSVWLDGNNKGKDSIYIFNPSSTTLYKFEVKDTDNPACEANKKSWNLIVNQPDTATLNASISSPICPSSGPVTFTAVGKGSSFSFYKNEVKVQSGAGKTYVSAVNNKDSFRLVTENGACKVDGGKLVYAVNPDPVSNFIITNQDYSYSFAAVDTTYDTYTWTLPNASNPTGKKITADFTAFENQVVSVTLKVDGKNGCNDTTIKQFKVISLNTLIIDNNKAVRVFPQPANDVLQIEVLGNWVPQLAQFTDLSGRVVANIALNAQTKSLDVSKLTPGQYILKIQGEGKSVATSVIIQ